MRQKAGIGGEAGDKRPSANDRPVTSVCGARVLRASANEEQASIEEYPSIGGICDRDARVGREMRSGYETSAGC